MTASRRHNVPASALRRNPATVTPEHIGRPDVPISLIGVVRGPTEWAALVRRVLREHSTGPHAQELATALTWGLSSDQLATVVRSLVGTRPCVRCGAPLLAADYRARYCATGCRPEDGGTC